MHISFKVYLLDALPSHCLFPFHCTVQGNTFQGILITDGWRSYAVFTYKCGLLEWSGGATIGFYAEGDFYMNHPLSGVNSTQIACVNGDLLWSNVVYSLNGMLQAHNQDCKKGGCMLRLL